MTTLGELMIAFVAGAYGRLTPNLMKYTAELEGDRVQARIVVLDQISEAELDEVFDILGHVVSHTGGTADFDLIRASSVDEAYDDPELSIGLFRAYALEREFEKRLLRTHPEL